MSVDGCNLDRNCFVTAFWEFVDESISPRSVDWAMRRANPYDKMNLHSIVAFASEYANRKRLESMA